MKNAEDIFVSITFQHSVSLVTITFIDLITFYGVTLYQAPPTLIVLAEAVNPLRTTQGN